MMSVCSPDALFEGSMTQSPSAGVTESGLMNSDPERSTWCKSGVNKVNCSKTGSNTGSPPTQLIMSYKRQKREREREYEQVFKEKESYRQNSDRLQTSEIKNMNKGREWHTYFDIPVDHFISCHATMQHIRGQIQTNWVPTCLDMQGNNETRDAKIKRFK